MSASPPRPDPPYRAIAAEIRDRIESGDLLPGDRAPSIRQIAQRWDVAIATATKAAAVLRDEGLVEPRVGSGTVVSAHPRPLQQSSERRSDPIARAAMRSHLLQGAIAVADAEGLEAVSMRRLATHLGVGPMSLYRHVANKDELLALMADTAFAEIELPNPGPPGWRPKLELIARAEWQLFRRHLWLSEVVSFTRPLQAPAMMAHTEWVLAALEGLGLPMGTRMQEALTLHALVLSVAASVAQEIDIEERTGVPRETWQAVEGTPDSRRFPLLAAVPAAAARDARSLFEYGLERHLDGVAVLIAGRQQPGRARDRSGQALSR